jgi:hypothetical protein
VSSFDESGITPETPAEWQEAVNAAEFMLLLDSARQYGLVSGGPEGDLERCRDMLKRGADLGYTPTVVTELQRSMR